MLYNSACIRFGVDETKQWVFLSIKYGSMSWLTILLVLLLEVPVSFQARDFDNFLTQNITSELS